MLIVSMFLLAVGVISSSGISPPNIKDFKPVLSKELEFRVNDCKTAFVGKVIVYQNPNDLNEFVRVYYRQVAVISECAKENNADTDADRARNLSNLNYHRKQEKETLDRVQKAIDAFAYVKWQTVRDLRTGEDIQSGPMQIWLLDSSGAYAYDSQPENAEENALKYSPFNEPSDDDSVMVGLKFVLGDAAHIVRVDPDDISASVKEETNEKK